ncbi:hypothetical protein [Pseudomonas syringae]|uniref:hypothetical protein n=1 Tax=Pseudomonas syringae TaxID=317 RepID=UPI0018E636FC|nr:hypothetical protein [Pseudomonas syringae]MBI6749763.1 hypothetical protein [Pseudomonas syringae]MBI6771792.1 hypothetical protein [Pseudomonas syringae]MBI6775223.1 hypothetical protein [Pseudomonas syringae]MBI6793008.1 hypothetical protein [Pseudomonas syringae]MBI6800333.1 hypothetical protein [Pseudomonas syringae]
MGIENLMVAVSRVPELVVNTGTDWVAILSSLTAIVAVVAGSMYNAYAFKKTISSQERIADSNFKFLKSQSKGEFLAKSRLEWIAIFREHVAAFLAMGTSVHSVAQYIVDVSWVRGDNPQDFNKSKELYDIRYTEFADKMAQARLHFAQLELLVSRTREDSSILIDAMSEYINAASTYKPIVDKGHRVVEVTQKILDDEWGKVKRMDAL